MHLDMIIMARCRSHNIVHVLPVRTCARVRALMHEWDAELSLMLDPQRGDTFTAVICKSKDMRVTRHGSGEMHEIGRETFWMCYIPD